MTTPSTPRKAGPLNGNGSTTAFPFAFKVFAASDIKVVIANSANVETVLVLNTDYTVSLNANQETSPGGTVTYPISGSALPAGSVLSIIGNLDYSQPLDLPSGGNFSPIALENQLDRATMQIQQLKEQVDRSAKLPVTYDDSDLEAFTEDIVRLADSADNIDTLVANLTDITTVADDLNEPVSEINTVAGSIANVNTVGNNIANVNTVAGVSANVTTVAGISANVTTVAGIAANVTAVAGNAANINTVAGNNTNVAAVGSNIANVNAVAANEASIDTVAGISSAVSAVAAIDDAVSIAATNVADINNFADVYQGGKAADPTLRNDGSALQDGDLYFNTTLGRMRVRVFGVWDDAITNVGSFDIETFSGTGAQTAFTLGTDPLDKANCQIYISGVYQQKTKYDVLGTTLTFVTAPPAGTDNIEVVITTPTAFGNLSTIQADVTAKAATATTQAGIATTQASTATTQAGIATTQAGLAATARAGAETARDAAYVNANVYDTTAAGLAATTNGQQFQVVSGGEIIRYRNNSGSAVEVARYPKGGFQRYMGIAATSTVPEVTTNNYYVARTPGTYTNFSGLVVGNEIAYLRYNGSAWIKETIVNFATPNSVIGEVVKGAIYPASTGVSTQVAVKVQPGTQIVARYNDTKQVVINVTAGTNLVIDSATTHPNVNNQNTGRLYCSLAGQLAIVYGTTTLPAGEWVLVASLYDYNTATGNAGAYFPFLPIIPTNHFFYNRANDFLVFPNLDKRAMNIKDLGALVDGATDDVLAFSLYLSVVRAFNSALAQVSVWSAAKKPYTLFFPAGTCLCSMTTGANFDQVKFVGAGKDTSILKPPSGLSAWNFFAAEDMTIWNIRGGSFGAPEKTSFKNVRFKWDAGLTGGATYCLNTGTRDYEIVECDFDYAGTVYIPLYVTNYKNVLIERNTFNDAGTGYASHAIRIETPAADKHNVIVRHNKVVGGTTGIFFASNRVRPIANVLVELNECLRQVEESISFDGFGNNAGLCPVICNGLITSATNDANGRLVITAAMKYHNGSTPNVDCPVSTRSDWTTFYFSLDEGSGREGTVTRIISANSATNEFTLETRTPAAAITVGGWCGVQSGFFDCAVRNNVIIGAVGNSPNFNYATALSIYLNVFNFTIEGNTVVGCANGINLAGGLMLTTYRTLAYNNVVKNNRFMACNERTGDAVVRFESYYSTIKQYNNQFVNNAIQGGKKGVYMRYQANLIYEDNVIDHVDAFDWKYCANTLPTPNATQIGRTFMKITEDGSGNPTTIEYYVCKLAGGTYSWVAV